VAPVPGWAEPFKDGAVDSTEGPDSEGTVAAGAVPGSSGVIVASAWEPQLVQGAEVVPGVV
jgi:hypothetical protein